MNGKNIELLKANEIRKILKTSKTTFTKIMKSKGHPPYVMIGGEYRFNKKQFYQWLEENTKISDEND